MTTTGMAILSGGAATTTTLPCLMGLRSMSRTACRPKTSCPSSSASPSFAFHSRRTWTAAVSRWLATCGCWATEAGCARQATLSQTSTPWPDEAASTKWKSNLLSPNDSRKSSGCFVRTGARMTIRSVWAGAVVIRHSTSRIKSNYLCHSPGRICNCRKQARRGGVNHGATDVSLGELRNDLDRCIPVHADEHGVRYLWQGLN